MKKKQQQIIVAMYVCLTTVYYLVLKAKVYTMQAMYERNVSLVFLDADRW